MSNKIKFTIECEMDEHWVEPFYNMLKFMENNGKLGLSSVVGLYSDGDGDFRPKFKTDLINVKKIMPKTHSKTNIVFDRKDEPIDFNHPTFESIFKEHYPDKKFCIYDYTNYETMLECLENEGYLNWIFHSVKEIDTFRNIENLVSIQPTNECIDYDLFNFIKENSELKYEGQHEFKDENDTNYCVNYKIFQFHGIRWLYTSQEGGFEELITFSHDLLDGGLK